MDRGRSDSGRGRALRRIAAALLALTLILAVAAGVASWVSFRAWSVTAAEVASVRPTGRVATAVLPFRYRGRTRFLRVRISSAELDAARRLRTDSVFSQPAPLRDAYLRTLVRTQSTSLAVRETARQLRAIRDELRLDSDEYVELMALAVQDMPYGSPRSAFELPVRSLAAGRGVCVDRSLLLAALLVSEGYDAGLWTLASGDHVAVAVRGVGRGYRGSGYVYVESTRRAYVGEVPDPYLVLAASEPAPRLVVLGRGRAYRADAETELIVDERRRAEREARHLDAYTLYVGMAPGRRELYVHEVARGLEAEALARQLRGCVDDRRLAFAVLETLNGWARPGRS